MIEVRHAEAGDTCGSCIESGRGKVTAVLVFHTCGVSGSLCGECGRMFANAFVFILSGALGQSVQKVLGMAPPRKPKK